MFSTIYELLYPLHSLFAAEENLTFVSLLWAGAIGVQSFHNVLINWKANLVMGLPTSAPSHQDNLMSVSE